MLELWGKRSTHSLSSLPGPIYGSNRTKQCTSAKLNCLKYDCFDIEIKYLVKTELFEIELFD